MTDARVVVLREYGVLGVEEVTLPAVGDHQVEVELLAAGVQPAQLRMVQAADPPDHQPVVPGLEGVGVVTAIGSRVARARCGDLVIIGATPAAGVDRPAQSPQIRFGGAQSDRPVCTWATNAIVDEQFVTPAPGAFRDRESLALLGDTVLMAAAAVLRGARVKAGDRVAVFGGGGTALAAMAVAKALGAGAIIAVADSPIALDMARGVGATDLIAAADGDLSIAAGFIDHAFDCALEHGGPPPSRALLRDGGTLQLLATAGTPQGHAALAVRAAQIGADCAPPADPAGDLAVILGWIESGVFDPAKLIRGRYTIEQINEAVMSLETGPSAGQPLMIVEPLR